MGAVGSAHRVGQADVPFVCLDAGLLPQLPYGGVPPVLGVVDEAAGQGEMAAPGFDRAGDDDE